MYVTNYQLIQMKQLTQKKKKLKLSSKIEI